MNYPLISEYIESILNAEDNFDKLSHLRPVFNETGSPIMSSGNFAVVFKMTDGQFQIFLHLSSLKELKLSDEEHL